MAEFIQTVHKPIWDTGSVTAYTGSAGNSGTLPEGTHAVWVLTTTAAYVKVGDTAVASADDLPLPANTPFLIAVEQPPESQRVSAIQVSSGGNLHVMPLAY